MNRRLLTLGPLVLVAAAALGTLAAGEDIEDVEATLFMVTAVIAGLVCFDTSMTRRYDSFAPWLALSVAPVVKTVPSVWFRLFEDNDLWPQRYEHAGSLAFGVCVLIAVLLLVETSPTLGEPTRLFNRLVIAGTTASAMIAGASVAFLFERDFGTEAAARWIETPTWAVIGALLAATTIAASHQRILTPALTSVLAVAAATAALLAYTVAGRDVDRGVWAMLFAGLAVSATGFGEGNLAQIETRDRRSSGPAVVAALAAVAAAGAAIAARSDRLAWGPGWALLGLLALALFAAALSGATSGEADPEGYASPAAATDSTASAAEQKSAALRSLRAAAESRRQISASAGAAVTPSTFGDATRASSLSNEPVAVEPELDEPPTVAPESAKEPVAVAPTPVAKPMSTPVEPTPSPGLSDRSLVATARAQLEASHIAAKPHHFDPSTGLRSATGLQDLLVRSFDSPPDAGQVTILMLAIRDLDEIEAKHGRLTSAAVTREMANRLRSLLPDGDAARFTRSAYAVIFQGTTGEPSEVVQRNARVLIRLRAAIADSIYRSEIDVVAGMAQCYAGEDAAHFVQRANLGLARAVQTTEPSLVAMP